MKICVLGASHMATIHAGWKLACDEYPRISMTFFGRFGPSMNGLFEKNGKLYTDDEKLAATFRFLTGGLDVIDPDEYDLFLLYGMEASTNFVEMDRYYSSQVKQKALDDLIDGTMSHGLLKKLLSITDKPVYITHNPLIAAEEVVFDGELECYLAGLDILRKEYSDAYGVTFVGQPSSTIVNGRNTHPMHSLGAPRLSRPGKENILYDDTDRFHMNPEFGRLWLKDFFDNQVEANQR